MVELLAYAEHPLVSLGNLELIAFMGTKIYKKQTNEQNFRHFKRCNKLATKRGFTVLFDFNAIDFHLLKLHLSRKSE